MSTETTAPRTEPIPEELLRICQPLRERADALMAEATALRFRAEGLAESVRITIGTGMNMLPVDTFDLDAGTVTRGAAAEEGKP